MGKHMKYAQVHWVRGLIGLIVFAAVILLFKSLADSYAASIPPDTLPVNVYRWELQIPFLSLSIIPYFSLYGFCILSFFMPTTGFVQRQHMLRLVVAVPVAYVYFYLYPVVFLKSMLLPHDIFKRVLSMDVLFGHAPALHTILLVIVWRLYMTQLSGVPKIIMSIWFLLAGLSAVTTYQYSVIDIVSGFTVGVLICYLFPFSEHHRFRRQYASYPSLAFRYLAPVVILFIAACFVSFWFALVLFWLSASMFFVGLGYLGMGPAMFQKHRYGKFSYAGWLIHVPYRLGTRLARRFFLKGITTPQKITDFLYQGAYGMQGQVEHTAVFDLCSEYERIPCREAKYVSFPIINEATPTIDELHEGVLKLDKLLKENRTVFYTLRIGQIAQYFAGAGLADLFKTNEKH